MYRQRPPSHHPPRPVRYPISSRYRRDQTFDWRWVLLAFVALMICGVAGWSAIHWWRMCSFQYGVTADPGNALPQATPLSVRPTVILPLFSPTRQPASVQPISLDIPVLQLLILDLVNADRRAASLFPVEWDDFAAQVGTAHAQEMAEHNYMSHWNLQGYGPDVRYSLAGGADAIMENVYMYWYRYDDGRPAPIEDWAQVIREAQASLMNSPGHRANILDPDHTHIGIGIAYNAQTGDVRIAQEFVNRYVMLDTLPRQVRVGDEVDVAIALLSGASEPLINLAYEPFPQPFTVNDLTNKMPGTYKSPAEFFKAINPTANDGRFTARVALDYNSQPGLYHVRVWVKANGRDVQASDIVIEVK